MLVRPGDVINLLERPPQFFYVSGRVNSPGEKTFRRGLTLTQAIIAAGGLGKDAKKAQLARDNGHGFLIVTSYKLKDIQSGKMPDPAVQPGDRITISN
jgi:protein involved in polysaccharide export with SLBB domain